MCFTQSMSFSFGTMGIIASYIMYINKYYYASLGIFYFSLMEILQGLQYFVIDECDNYINKLLTYIGYLHICFQPVFISFWLYEFIDNKKKHLEYLKFIIGLCLAGAILLATRVFIIAEDTLCNTKTEPLCGEKTCSLTGKYHIVWNIKLRAPGTYYWTPSISLHFFLLCIPYIVLGIILKNYKVVALSLLSIVSVFILYFLLVYYYSFKEKQWKHDTENIHELASIWCFLFIPQTILTFLLLKM